MVIYQLKPCTSLETRNTICISVIWVWRVGWGGAITFMSTWTRMDWDLLLHFHTHVMLRSGIFFCTCTHTSCYALRSSFALAHARHATLWDLLLHLHTHVMLRSGIFFCTCTRTSRHATLWDLLLHFHTHVMLRSGIFSCPCTHPRHSTLWDLLLHFHTHVMLRSGSASGIFMTS